MIRSGLLLGAGNIISAVFSLVRNVVIARLISVEDFGIASTFVITMSLVEMTSYLAVDRLIIQAQDGDAPRLLSTAHAIQAARGALGAIVLFFMAKPLATLFEAPQLAWAYGAMALVPLLRGLAHLDMFRRQRKMQFLPTVSIESISQAVSTAAAGLLAYALADYRAMLFALVLQQLAYTVTSHVVATQPYRWAWDSAIARRVVRFGWPLLLNGLLMFGIFQGDRVIVGSLIGLTELGWFSVAFSLTLMPTLLLNATLHSYFLPQLARAQLDPAEFDRLRTVVIQAALLIGVGQAVFVALVGPTILILLYGPRYEASLSVLTLLAVMQAVRLAKAGPMTVALSTAQTSNPLIANIARAVTLLIAGLLAYAGVGVRGVVFVGIVGEGLAFAVSLLRLNLPMSVLSHNFYAPCAVGAAALALICVDARLWEPGLSLGQNLHVFQLLLVIAIAPLVWSMPALQQWVRSLLAQN